MVESGSGTMNFQLRLMDKILLEYYRTEFEPGGEPVNDEF